MPSDEWKGLPPGLLTREGTPLKPNQRLPSLRGPTASTSNGFTHLLPPAPNLTKGGAAKRQFKPTIPTRRNVATESSTSSSAKTGKQPRQRNKKNDKDKREKGKFKGKGTIMCEGAVFTGVISGSKTSRRQTESYEIRLPSERKPFSKSEKKVEIRTAAVPATGVYRDDFIENSDSDSGDDQHPKGWENLADLKNEEVDEKPRVNVVYEWFKNPENRLALFQMPEIFTNKTEGKVGKIRIYKSNRVEFVDTRTGISFDLIENNVLPTISKDAKSKNSSSENALTQEIVSINDTVVTNLDTLDSRHTFIAVPNVPDVFNDV